MKNQDREHSIIPQKIKEVFNKLSFSARYVCPIKSTPCTSQSYDLQKNYCYSCGKKGNNVAKIIHHLSENHKGLFGGRVIEISEARSILKTNSIPEFYHKPKSKAELEEESQLQDLNIAKFISDSGQKYKYGSLILPDSKIAHFAKTFNLDQKKIQTPLKIYFQNTQYTKNLSFGTPPFIVGSHFFKGTNKPKHLIIESSPSGVIDNRIDSDTYCTTINGPISYSLKKHLASGQIETITVPDENSFEVIMGEISSKKLNLPKINIVSSDTAVPSMSSDELSGFFKPTKKTPPDGANYQNIDDPKDFDNILSLGYNFVELTDNLSKETKLMVKTGALPIANLLTNTQIEPKGHFTSTGREVDDALSILRFRDQTDNIKKEIILLESLSDTQKKSLDLQLQVAKAVRKLFPGEYFGVKGSANNLNILYDMGITSLDPSEDKLLSPFSFLDPDTDKNPDIDFELSSSQVTELVNKYPSLTKGLTVTTAGDRVHVCKFFIDVPDDLKQFQAGNYIPKDSKIIEKLGATPVDLIQSRVIENMNELSKSLDNPDVPSDYSVSFSDIQSQDLPHFNKSVQFQMKKKGVAQPNKEFTTEELSSFCALNRPVFYYSMVVLKDESNNRFYYSYSGKTDNEALYPLDQKSKDAMEKNITTEDIKSVDYASKKIGNLSVHFMKSNYLVSPPEWVRATEEELLSSTDGVIVYQDQLMLILEKYTSLKPQEINDVLKKIAHPTKSENLNIEEFFSFKYNTPSNIQSQVKFITCSQNAFFFKKGHALFLAETARKMSYLKKLNAQQDTKSKDAKIVKFP